MDENQVVRTKGAKTPGVKLDRVHERVPLGNAQSKSYRGLVALANYIAQDRADIGFAAKEVSKTMSDPAECDIQPLKRLGRYLIENPRCVNLMRWQSSPSSWDCYSDSDWGGISERGDPPVAAVYSLGAICS